MSGRELPITPLLAHPQDARADRVDGTGSVRWRQRGDGGGARAPEGPETAAEAPERMMKLCQRIDVA
jgi:hypothetical protein